MIIIMLLYYYNRIWFPVIHERFGGCVESKDSLYKHNLYKKYTLGIYI